MFSVFQLWTANCRPLWWMEWWQAPTTQHICLRWLWPVLQVIISRQGHGLQSYYVRRMGCGDLTIHTVKVGHNKIMARSRRGHDVRRMGCGDLIIHTVKVGHDKVTAMSRRCHDMKRIGCGDLIIYTVKVGHDKVTARSWCEDDWVWWPYHSHCKDRSRGWLYLLQI